jgi:hypothetical protein
VIVELTPWEIAYDLDVGQRRSEAARAQGRRDRRGPDNSWWSHFLGVHGEHVVAKALGVYFAPDVGGNDSARGDVCGLQVRTRSSHSYDLWLEDHEPGDALFALVTGEPPRLDIRGVITGDEARRVGERLRLHGARATFVKPYLLTPWEERPFISIGVAS